MMTSRAAMSVILLCAIVLSPIAAMAAPCCCMQPVEQRPECCIDSKTEVSTPVHACCLHEQDVVETPPVAISPGCCCVKSLPPTVLPKEIVLQKTDSSSLVALPTPVDAQAAWIASVQTFFPGLQFPDEPSIPVRFCVWLK